MNRSLVLLITVFISAGLSAPLSLSSQEITNPETEYLRVRSMAFEGDYAGAAAEGRKLVNAFPEYGDARILLGRILAWQKDYSQALAVLDTLLVYEPGNADARAARRDIKLWSKESSPVATDIRAGYALDSFTEPYSRFWQIFSLGAGHRFNWGPASAGINIGKINTGNLTASDDTDIQFETEAWPKLTDKNYAYLAYAFSPGDYFPRHRAAVEIWQMFPEEWALSAGCNYYYFNRNIFIAGLSFEKYISRYWFSLKYNIYFKDDGPTNSFYVNARRYFNDIDYLQLTLGTGTAPDEPFDVQTDVMRLSANAVRLTYNRSINKKLIMRIGAGYSREEYSESVMRNRFEANLGFTYAVKMK